MDQIREELMKYAQSLGLDLFGVADLTEKQARCFILRQGGEHIGSFPKAISLGIRLLDPVVDQLYRHEDPSAIHTYRGLYNSVNLNLDRTALLIANRIQKAGFNTYPIPASQTVDSRKLEVLVRLQQQHLLNLLDIHLQLQ